MTEELVEPTLSQGIGKIVAKLFPSWPIMVSTLISLFLMVLLMHFFFRKPIRSILLARQKEIQDQIDGAAKLKKEALAILQQQKDELQSAYLKAQNIIKEAKLQAEKISQSYISDSQKKAESLKQVALQEVDREKRLFEEKSKEYIIQTALILARNILEREVNLKDNQRLLEKILQQQKEENA